MPLEDATRTAWSRRIFGLASAAAARDAARADAAAAKAAHLPRFALPAQDNPDRRAGRGDWLRLTGPHRPAGLRARPAEKRRR